MSFPDEDAAVCVNCTDLGKVVSPRRAANHSEYCIGCGGDTQLDCLVDAIYEDSTLSCVCPPGHVLIQQVGSIELSAFMCAPCSTGECTACSYPYAVGADGQCRCVDGFTTLSDGMCVPEDLYETLSGVAANTGATLVPPNMVDSPSTPVSSQLVAAHALESAVRCKMGNMTACDFLSNLCVMMLYNQTSTPCALYLHLKSEEACQDEWCERPLGLPWLYYMRSSTQILEASEGRRVLPVAGAPLTYVVSKYRFSGEWLGYSAFIDQMNLCDLPSTVARLFYNAGETRIIDCAASWDWFFLAQDADFFEVYMQNPYNSSDLIPVPVLLDYNGHSFHPDNMFDPWMYRPAAESKTTPPASGFRRRFYAYDNLVGRPSPNALLPGHVTAATAFSVVLGSNKKQRDALYTPLLVIQYTSKRISTVLESADNYTLQNIIQERVTAASRRSTVRTTMRSFYLLSDSSDDRGMMIALTVVSALAFLAAWGQTYGWMRRRQNLVIDGHALLRFVVFLSNHIGNAYIVVAALSSWYLFIAYKAQDSLSRAIETKQTYVENMLYVAVATKGLHALYRLVEQCNADYFVIDWERSKGQLLRENKIVPVAMWRSTFLANELSELQQLRSWHPLLSMAIIMLFIVGLGYNNYSASTPSTNRKPEHFTESFAVLRIAVDSFFWFSVSLVMYLLEQHIFYRFIVVHPLQAFVDLCSVSNTSIVILTEPQFGYYIHGESIHAHSDVSMEEFQQNLFLEAQGNLPVRGLGGQSKCQTFEIYLCTYMRQYLRMCYAEMELEQQKDKYDEELPDPLRWHFFSFIKGFSRKPKVYSSETLVIKDRINDAFKQSVRRAEGVLWVKFALQQWFGFAPNILYMNGPQRGDHGGKDLFFFDEVLSYGQAFLYGLDFDLCVLYGALFCAIDCALNDVYAAIVLAFTCEIVFSWYRKQEGLANLSMKTLIDDRFFI